MVCKDKRKRKNEILSPTPLNFVHLWSQKLQRMYLLNVAALEIQKHFQKIQKMKNIDFASQLKAKMTHSLLLPFTRKMFQSEAKI